MRDPAHYWQVYATLIIDGDSKGQQVFIVRLRDDNGHLLPGVKIQDMGLKGALNGAYHPIGCT